MLPLQTYLKTKDTAIILRCSCYFLVTVSISQSNSERKSISQHIWCQYVGMLACNTKQWPVFGQLRLLNSSSSLFVMLSFYWILPCRCEAKPSFLSLFTLLHSSYCDSRWGKRPFKGEFCNPVNNDRFQRRWLTGIFTNTFSISAGDKNVLRGIIKCCRRETQRGNEWRQRASFL